MIERSFRAGLGLAFLIGGLASGCSGEGLARYDDSFCKNAIAEPGSVDAADWLRISSSEPKQLGAMSSTESLAFVDRLESSGARRTVVVGLSPQAGERGPALVIALPSEPSARLAVFQLYAKHVRNLGLEPSADVGQVYLYLPSRP